MNHLSSIVSLPVAVAAFGLAAVAVVPNSVRAQNTPDTHRGVSTHQDRGRPASSAKQRVDDSVRIIDQMKRNPRLASLLERAKGVFIIPHYGKGGFIVGGEGGDGVVLAHRNRAWSNPAFFSIAGGSIGAQAGGEGGSVVMLLTTDKAMDKFANTNGRWALNGNAGLTVGSWSDKARTESGKHDVIVWTNTSGLYGGLTASVTDVTADRKMDHTYYGRNVSSRDILERNELSARAEPLRNALSTRVASR